jgi:DNA helicase-2/ATP-dependent DNA helicase PcrA
MTPSGVPKPETTKSPVLDSEQRAFVDHYHRSAMLHAPVGTGKTLVLAERAAKAICHGVDPRRILCVTFTNRAAEELRQRIALNCGGDAKSVVVRTFHSLCAWMLRVEAKQIGLPADFVIFDEDDSMETLKQCAKETDIHLVRVGYEDEATDAQNAISTAKREADDTKLSLNSVQPAAFGALRPKWRQLATAYQDELASYHALDFDDLVYFARAMLHINPAIRRRWSERFSMIQVDEMQDTHMSEYKVLRQLGQGSRNLTLAGDFDQTIYEWRGSQPDRVLNLFEKDFPESRHFSFLTNYRTTQTLVDAATSVASRYSNFKKVHSCSTAKEGDPIVVHFAPDSQSEAKWIARETLRLRQSGTEPGRSEPVRLGRIGVLTRTNPRAEMISEAFTNAGIPHLTVEQFQFFRRQEVKDAIAYLRFLCNPFDGRSLQRMLLRPPRNIGRRTVEQIMSAEETGLRLVDMVAQSTIELGDPFARLVHELRHGSVVVFDTETTGLNPAHDEIVELGAVRLERGQPVATFHRYLQNSVSVGDSYEIHGLSDEFLAANGEDPTETLSLFAAFADGALLVGHNVSFDMRMARANAGRLGLCLEPRECADTLDIARRSVDVDDHTLPNLVEHFNIPLKPAHRALDDVHATTALLIALIPRISESSIGRMQVVQKTGAPFVPLAKEIEAMRQLAEEARPHELLAALLDVSGLKAYYGKEPHRIENLEELMQVFRDKDDIGLDPISSLENILHFVALAKNVDRLDPDNERVRILTVHQSKGLEFDVVFVAGLSQHEFPGFRSMKEGRADEELRLFYVALTRARHRLYLTGHGKNFGKHREPSPYFGFVGDRWIERGSSGIGLRYGNRREGWRPHR